MSWKRLKLSISPPEQKPWTFALKWISPLKPSCEKSSKFHFLKLNDSRFERRVCYSFCDPFSDKLHSEIWQDRIKCIDACINAANTGNERQLPQTDWTVPPSTESLSITEEPQQPPRLAVQPAALATTTTGVAEAYPASDNFDLGSEDELWHQSGLPEDYVLDDIPPVPVSLPTFNNAPEIAIFPSEPDPSLLKRPFYSDIEHTLHHTFGLKSFRTNQLEAITANMEGHDVFVLMPTGGGKSLCFQLPAVCKNRTRNCVTVIIGPLVALMQDQVSAMQAKGLDIAFFTKNSTSQEASLTHDRLNHPERKPCMLYVTPEKLEHSNRLKDDLRKLHRSNQLGGIVVDEAHCITTWGRSFRESVC
jgi:hypothetical protein